MHRVRIAIWYATAYVFLVFSYPMIWCARFLNYRDMIKLKNALTNFFMIRFSKLMFYLTGSRLQICGLENIPKDRPVLFVSNHQGHMDSFIIQGFITRPKGFITITEFQRAPILRTWMKYMGCEFIDRSDVRQQLTCINRAIDTLKSGHSMVVYPEGKLNDGKDTFKFQKGWLRMATKSGVPIVPITISDSYKVLSYNGRRIRSAKVECIISQPIETVGLKREDESEFILNLRNIILEHLNN